MIHDCHADPAHARLYDVVDPATYGPLNGMRIFYADDSTHVVRRFLVDDRGHVYPGPDGDLAWEEIKMPIRIVRRKDRQQDTAETEG